MIVIFRPQAVEDVVETLYVHAVLHGARHDRRWTERL